MHVATPQPATPRPINLASTTLLSLRARRPAVAIVREWIVARLAKAAPPSDAAATRWHDDPASFRGL